MTFVLSFSLVIVYYGGNSDYLEVIMLSYVVLFYDVEYVFASRSHALDFGRYLRGLIYRDGIVRLIYRPVPGSVWC